MLTLYGVTVASENARHLVTILIRDGGPHKPLVVGGASPSIGLLTRGSPADNGHMEIVPAGHPPRGDLTLLEQEEQKLSRERSLLHARIDDLYLKAPLDDEQVAQLDKLEELERDISLDRRNLHRQIDKLRAELGMPPVGEGRELDDVA